MSAFSLPPIFLFLILLLAPFPGARVTLANLPLYAPEILILIWLSIALWKHPKTIFVWPKSLVFPTTLLLISLLASLAVHFTPHGLGIVKSWFVFPILFAWLVTQSIRHEASWRLTLLAWYGAALCIVVIALSYLATDTLTYDDRLRAFFLSPNHLALFTFPVPILGIFLLRESFLSTPTPPTRKDTFALVFLAGTITLSLIVLFFTFSYTVWISILFGCTLFLTLRHSRFSPRLITRISIGFLIIISILFVTQSSNPKLANWFASPERSSLASRVMIWKSSVKMIADQPIIGIGPGNFQDKYLDYQKYFPPYLEWAAPEPHNLYLAFWLESGFFGLAGFLWLIASWITLVWRSSRNNEKRLLSGSLCLALLGSVLVQGLFDTPYWKTDLAYLFWLTLALGMSLLRGFETNEKAE